MLALSSLGTFVDATNTVDLLDFLMADVRTKPFLQLEGVVGGAFILSNYVGHCNQHLNTSKWVWSAVICLMACANMLCTCHMF